MSKKPLSIKSVRTAIVHKGQMPEANNLRTVYLKLITRQYLSDEDKQSILRTIAYFMYIGDNNVRKMAYAMALWYGCITSDYLPILDIATQLRYYPVVELIKSYSDISEQNIANDASALLEVALSEAYKGDYYRSEQQYALSRAIETKENITAIAPTSYGKSAMLIRKVIRYYGAGSNICILVPTKSLILQTLRQCIQIKGDRKGIIIHPDAFNNEHGFIAIFTQERLSNFHTQYPEVTLDYIFVDEAHNLMDGDERSLTLSRCLMIAKIRNPKISIDFFSPFIINPEASLELIHVTAEKHRSSCVVKEHMKIPRYMVWDNESKKLEAYDQFTGLKSLIKVANEDCATFIMNNSGEKNIIYANTPEQAERFANELALKLPPMHYDTDEQAIIDEFCQTLSSTVHQSYNLINLLRHGIIISHGKMLDNIKDYSEELYRKLKQIQYVVTTSTLLEGVNLPAEKLFLLNFYKGRGNLNYSSFHNLVGRVARYNQIFNFTRPNISLLTPEVYFIKGDYLNNRSNDPMKFLDNNAKEGIKSKDEVNNPLLVACNVNKLESEKDKQVTLMANADQPNVPIYNKLSHGSLILAKTDIGRLMYENNILPSIISEREDQFARAYLEWHNSNYDINNGQSAMNAIYRIFLLPAYRNAKSSQSWEYSLFASINKRIIYGQIIDDRIANKRLGTIIGKTIASWKHRIGEPVYVGSMGNTGKIGDEINGFYLNYHIFSKDETKLMPSYALALHKENLDHLDYHIMPFFEVMHALGLIGDEFYLEAKYGTKDKRMIELIKMGFDIPLALVIAKDEDLTGGVKKYNLDATSISREDLIMLFKNKGLSGMALNAIENII